MRVSFADFDMRAFSFDREPFLVLTDFWSPEELDLFAADAGAAAWTSLEALPAVRASFPNSGNWRQARLGSGALERLVARLRLPIVGELFGAIAGDRPVHLGFDYYAYGVGDSLDRHDDRADYRGMETRRRLAVSTYLHREWAPDWGGELVADRTGAGTLEGAEPLPPEPGSLVLFTVPRLHLVRPVLPAAGAHERLSISGWFSTEI